MQNPQSQLMIEQPKPDMYQFLAWQKLADCYGILFDENVLKTIVGLEEEEVLDTLLSSADMLFSEDEKQRVIEERQHYYSDYVGAY